MKKYNCMSTIGNYFLFKSRWLNIFSICLFVSFSVFADNSVEKRSVFHDKRNISWQTDSIDKLKFQANNDSQTIVDKIYCQSEKGHPINAETINELFKNLRTHYIIDSISKSIFVTAFDDSIKRKYWEKLIVAYDFYGIMFQRDKKIRRIINRGDLANHLPAQWLCSTQDFLWNNTNYIMTKESGIEVKSYSQKKIFYLIQKYCDFVSESIYNAFGFLCKTLYCFSCWLDVNPDIETTANLSSEELKKWDIVCKKKQINYYKCHLLISGTFSHVAIYFGNGIVAESTPNGVVFSKLDHFSASNSAYLVLRLKDISYTQSKAMENCLKKQIGKSYDFKFDIESPDRLICTELVYLVYNKIDWHSQSLFGKKIIYPDNIVETALSNPNLRIPLFVSDSRIEYCPESKKIAELIQMN